MLSEDIYMISHPLCPFPVFPPPLPSPSPSIVPLTQKDKVEEEGEEAEDADKGGEERWPDIPWSVSWIVGILQTL